MAWPIKWSIFKALISLTKWRHRLDDDRLTIEDVLLNSTAEGNGVIKRLFDLFFDHPL